MFSFKNKLDYNLNIALKNNSYKKYRVLVKCKNLFSSIVKKISHFKGALIYSLDYCNIVVANLNKYEIKKLIEYPEVESIFLDDYLFLCGISVTSANNCNLYDTNKSKYSGKNINIGLVDSGVFPHPDLLSPNNKIEYFFDLINEFKYPYDDNGHGTAIAGIMCSSGLNSNNLYKGISPSSNIICYKAFDKLGKGYASDVLYSIECLIKLSEEKNIRILCLPFELLNLNYYIINAFKCVFDVAIKHNLIPIVPSGSVNYEKDMIKGIATLNNCITVGGVNSSKPVTPYLYSSKGPYNKIIKPNCVASCTNIASLNSNTSYVSERNGIKVYPSKLNSNYKTFSGTSLAVAFVCSVCALILESNPSYTFNDVLSIIKLACDKKDLPKDIVGNGILSFNNILK